MSAVKIKREFLEKIIELSSEAYPREVGGILLGNPIDDFVIIPGRFNYTSIYMRFDQLPIYVNLAGTFHSHPSPHSVPSQADLNLFRRIGKTHLIIAYPYDFNSFQAYNSMGKKIELEIV